MLVRTFSLFMLTGVVLAIGCNRGGMPKIEKQPTVPVTGMLTYKSKPVANASVIFMAIDGKVSSYGATDASGTFALSTYGTRDGAPPGRYKVVVAAGGPREVEPGVLEDEPPGGFKSPVPAKYGKSNTTDIVLVVKEEGKNDFTIDLK